MKTITHRGATLRLTILLLATGITLGGCNLSQRTGGQDKPITWTAVDSPVAASGLKDIQGAPIDLGKPYVGMGEGSLLVINLPRVIPLKVTGMRLDDSTLTVTTDAPDLNPSDWMKAAEVNLFDPAPPKDARPEVLRPSNLGAKQVKRVVLTDVKGNPVDIRIGYEEAVKRASDEARTDFPRPDFVNLAYYRPQPEAKPDGRVWYFLDYTTAQSISRDGTTAVAGRIRVDAVTGEVKADLQVIAFEHTRLLRADTRFLGWVDGERFAALVHDQGGVALALVRKNGTLAKAVQLSPQPASMQDAVGNLSVVPDSHWTLFSYAAGPGASGTPGQAQIIDLTEHPARSPAGAVKVEVEFTRIPQETAARVRRSSHIEGEKTISRFEFIDVSTGRSALIPDPGFGDYRIIRGYAWSAEAGKLYFATEIEGPRYGIWVTEYKLWAYDPATGGVSFLTHMPTGQFQLSPDGRSIAYNCGSADPGSHAPVRLGNCSLITLP